MTQIVPAGWYTDPENPAQQRYWDGAAWTLSVAPISQTGAQSPIPVAPALASAATAAKGAAESALHFVDDRLKQREEKKRHEKEAAEAAARAQEEAARIQREKTLAFVRRYWKALLAGAAVFVLLASIASLGGNDAEIVDDKAAKGEASSPQPAAQDAAEPQEQVATDSSEQQAAEAKAADQRLEATFPVEKARRAAVVALTNATAVDVFQSDGCTYDVSKFHSYADTSGNVDDYFWDVIAWGTWSAKDEQTWHVESLLIKHRLGQEIDVDLDVRLDGAGYVVSNLTGTRGNPGHAEELYIGDGAHLSVPATLVADDRTQASVDALDHSGDLDKFVARTAFEKYGESKYPYGFKCAWTLGLIHEEQRSDGSWFFKVDAKVTNQYGATRSSVAEGVVYGTTASPTVKDFYAD